MVVNVITLLPKALKTLGEDASGISEAWSTNPLKMPVSACHGLNIASPQNSYIKTLSPTMQWYWEVGLLGGNLD